MAEQGRIKDWQNIIWRESYYCHEKDYATCLRQAVDRGYLKWLCQFLFNQQSRPYASAVEVALRTACAVRPQASQVWKKRLQHLDQARNESMSLNKVVEKLRAENWFTRFIARHVLLYRGGEAIEPLRLLAADGPAELYNTALWLLRSIGAETRTRLAANVKTFVCPNCLVHCARNMIFIFPPAQLPIEYYGCRICGQSLQFRIWSNGLVAMLDRQMATNYVEQNQQLRVNWLLRRSLFDFDRVEIVRATDEDVERFAVQVGNDTDPVRQPRYRQMQCLIGPEARLSENTLRILRHTFGQVITPQLNAAGHHSSRG